MFVKFICWIILYFMTSTCTGNTNENENGIQGSEISIADYSFDPDFSRDQISKCNSSTPAIQCADCYTKLFCTSGAKFQCPSRLPYCVNGNCVETKSPGCSVDLGNVCPINSDDMYYPDAKNCYVYYYCDKDLGATNAYSCPINFPFDMESQTCKRWGTCGYFNCFGQDYSIYSNAPSLGIFCNDNKVIDGTYVACLEGQQLGSSLNCEAKCVKEGNIPHETDKTRYYRCLPSGPWGAFVKTVEDCPKGQTFNNDKLKCTK